MWHRFTTNILTFKAFIFIFALLFFVFPQTSDAATLSILPNTASVNVGNIVSVKVVVNTEGQYINNGEAVIQFPADLLEVVSISKSPSIFSLWVEEPNFSNSLGRISFNGGVANPGFNGTSGTIASMTFKAKKAGSASIIFGDSAIRKNDGLGTDILGAKSSGTITISSVVSEPVPVVSSDPVVNGSPAKPVITSSTHPDQSVWYSADSASFNWKVPSGVTSIQAILNKTSNATPTISYDNSVTQKTLNNLSDGVFYFHLRYLNSTGWGPVAHYQINVDTTAPDEFSPTVRSEGSQNIIKLNAEDATSGVSYYTLKIDDEPVIKVRKSDLENEEYVLPVLNQGIHKVLVTAHDKADNTREASLEFSSSYISSPVLSLSLNEISKGDAVVIFGKTDYPGKQAEVTLEHNGKVIKKYIQTTSSDGSFSVVTDRIKNVGIVNIWAENIFSETVKSAPSEKIFLTVSEAEIVKVTFALFWLIIIMVMFVILLFITYEGWHKFFGLRKKIDRELEQTAGEAHKAMILLKEELNSQLERLEKTKSDRALNKKEQIIFTDIQKNVDDIDNFIKKRLRKMM